MNRTFPSSLLAAFLILFAFQFQSCKKSEDSYTTENLIPLLKTTLTLEDLSEDTLFSSSEGDSLVHVVYNADIYSYNLADQLVDLRDTFLSKKITLDSLKIPNHKFNYRMSLGNIAKGMVTSGNPTDAIFGNLLIQANGNTTPVPAVNNLASISEVFPTSQYFTRLVLSRGELQMWLANYLPIDVNNIVFVASDNVTSAIIFTDTISVLPAKDSIYKVYPLAGKTLEGDLLFELVSVNTPGSTGAVTIDTSDYIGIRSIMTKMYAQEATAVFPSTELVSITEEVTQDLDGAELTYIDAEEGQLHVFITSSVEEAMFLTYTLEGALDSMGNPLSVTRRVPAAPPGGLSTIDEYFDISGASIDLTGQDGTKFNTYTQTISGTIDSSGIVRTITGSDSLVIRYELINIKPRYLEGYAGQQQLQIGPERSDFDFFENLGNGSLSFETVNLDFVIDNQIGVGGEVRVNRIEGFNGGQSIVLTSPTFSNPFPVTSAADNPFQSSVTRIPLTSSNSNIEDLINLRPKVLEYELDIDINPGGNDFTYSDFAYFDKSLEVRLDMDMPLSVKASNLVLEDTVDFDIASTVEDLSSVDSGTLYLITYNSYPIRGDLEMVLLDELGFVVDTLLVDATVEAGPVDANCKVTGPQRTKISIPVTKQRLELLKLAKQAIIEADFSTYATEPACDGEFFKIYTDYELEVKLTARFTYRMGDIF